MGTTHTALTTQDGVRLGFTLVVEGYAKILSDAGPDERTAVATAYEETEWGELAGWGADHILDWFVIEGKIRRSIQFWQQDLDIPTLTFRVHNETFARSVCKSKPAYRSQLANPFSPAADGSGTITVKSNAAFPSSGTVYMGHKAFDYTAKSGSTQFTIGAGGAQKFTPFAAAAGNNYALPHEMSAGKNWDAAAQPWVSDVPPSWLGRRVALYVHRISGGIWDTVANARLEFAGRIREINEDTRTGAVVLQCEDILADVRDAQLLKQQWVGYVKAGIDLQTGDAFKLDVIDGSTKTTSGPLTIVASGASGNDELNAGHMELEDFVAALNKWIANDGTVTDQVNFDIRSTDGGRRFSISVSGTTGDPALNFWASRRPLLDFLGFRESVKRWQDADYPVFVQNGGDNDPLYLISDLPPFRVRPFQDRTEWDNAGNGRTIELESSDGSWVNHMSYLPAPYDTYGESGENWSFIRLGDSLMWAKYASATQLTDVAPPKNFATFSSDQRVENVGLTVDDAGDQVEIYQVVVLEDSFTSLVTKLLASTGTSGVNHATHDVFPTGMGCPGIPWALLGDDFVNSCKLLEQAVADEAMVIVLDRPTRLVDVLLPEFLLRFAWLTWKPDGGDEGNGGYHFVSPPTPNSLTADFTLDMSNKVAPAGQSDLAFASVRTTLEHCRNLIKVNYNRTPGGKYQDHLVFRDESSISDFKIMGVTIDAPNSYADSAGTGSSVESLAKSLVARTMPMISRPMKLVRRTIPHTLYGMSCGSTAVFSDDDVRDPTSGLRGISQRACIVVSVTHDPGHGQDGGEPFGEVELLLTDEDRTYPLAPAAEVDTSYSGTVDGITFTNGYAATAAGGPALKLKEHAYSRSDALTDAEGFANSDLVRVYEIDPADPTSFDAWNRTLAASGAVDATDDYIKLTSDISSPAWGGSTKLYRVVPQLYSAVQDSQKPRAFLADDADGLIENLAQPNLYGEKPYAGVFTRVTGADLPTLIATEVYAEGRPLHVGLLHDLIRMANNLADYKGAPHAPLIWEDNKPSTTTTDYKLAFVMPWPIGGFLYKATRRVLRIATRLGTSGAGITGTCRITSSRHAPRGPVGSTAVTWSGPKRSITFTRSSSGAADQAIQDLPIVKGDLPGMTWVTVEIKTTSGTTTLHNLPTFYQGPRTPA